MERRVKANLHGSSLTIVSLDTWTHWIKDEFFYLSAWEALQKNKTESESESTTRINIVNENVNKRENLCRKRASINDSRCSLWKIAKAKLRNSAFVFEYYYYLYATPIYIQQHNYKLFRSYIYCVAGSNFNDRFLDADEIARLILSWHENFIESFLPEYYPIRFSFVTDDSRIRGSKGKRANSP